MNNKWFVGVVINVWEFVPSVSQKNALILVPNRPFTSSNDLVYKRNMIGGLSKTPSANGKF